MRYIDADELDKALAKECVECMHGEDDCEVCDFAIARLYVKATPTIEAQPVNTDKCKALRNIEGICLILSNVYNTGSTLQDCDYDAIFKRLDVIKNILKGE